MTRWFYRIGLLVVLTLLVGCGDQAPTPLPAPTSTIAPATPTIMAPTPTPPAPTATPAATATQVVEAPISLAGSWVGGFTLADGSPKDQKLFLSFVESNGALQGQIGDAATNTSAPLGAITSTAGIVGFAWALPGDPVSDPVVFAGRASGHTLSGTVQRGAASGSFAFVRLAQPAASEYLRFVGTYRFASGHAFGFYETHDPQTQVFATPLVFVDLQSGDLAAAFPISSATFAIGPALGLAYPFAGEVTFLRDDQGAVSGLKWSHQGAADEIADKVTFATEDVRFRGGSGDAMLGGTLVSPTTPGTHPAVILIHGAGPMTRHNWLYDSLSALFALHGIATLSYDKRGVGDSGGSFVDNSSAQNLAVLAQDALAAVTYLQGRAEIDVSKIGMQGSSQAGWTIPLAASQSNAVAFMILWSGPGVSQSITDLYDHSAETTSRDTLTQILRDATPYGFDPLPALEKTTAAGFWAYGGQDMTVPVPESIAKLEQVTAAGQKDFTWQVYPSGDHFLLDVPSPDDDDLPFSRGFVPGLLDQMISWLEKHVQAQ